MHAPDHVLGAALSTTTAVLAAGGVAYAVHRVRTDLRPQWTALTVATTGLLFAAQMVDFPVLPGTSGHLVGAALAVALIGPWRAVLAVSVVLAIQALVFADGGLTALGTNVVVMALAGVGVAASAVAITRTVLGRLSPRRAAALAAALSVPASAAVLAVLYALGGVRPVPFGEFLGAMVGVHALIGLGEAAITVLVLSSVLALAPGLAAIDPRPAEGVRARSGVTAVGVAAAVSAVVLSTIASTSPDGLETVFIAYDVAAAPLLPAQGPFLADYGAAAGLPVPVAGAAGLLLATALTGLLMLLLGRGARSAHGADGAARA